MCEMGVTALTLSLVSRGPAAARSATQRVGEKEHQQNVLPEPGPLGGCWASPIQDASPHASWVLLPTQVFSLFVSDSRMHPPPLTSAAFVERKEPTAGLASCPEFLSVRLLSW